LLKEKLFSRNLSAKDKKTGSGSNLDLSDRKSLLSSEDLLQRHGSSEDHTSSNDVSSNPDSESPKKKKGFKKKVMSMIRKK
jgi:hypothetical protein